jgi:hypothetical protein
MHWVDHMMMMVVNLLPLVHTGLVVVPIDG